MLKIILLVPVLCLYANLLAQPYLDVAAVRYQGSPDAGAFRRGFQPNNYQYANAALNLPIVLKDSSVLLFNPAIESWKIGSSVLPQLPEQFYGMALPVAFVKPFNNKWTGTFLAVARWNGAEHFGFDHPFQLGGAVIMALKKSETLTYKFGVYYNREAFGNFFMPLLGIDWRPSPSVRLFGVLPGNLVLEKNVSRTFYYGLSFRATTTSYRYTSPQGRSFIRIEDNTLQAFADLYLTKNIVLNAEAGHSAFRRFRLGHEGASEKYFTDDKFRDNLLFRLGLLYRVRFDR